MCPARSIRRMLRHGCQRRCATMYHARQRRSACCSAKSSHHFSKAASRCVSTQRMRSCHVITRRHGTRTILGRVQRGICNACEASETGGRQANKANRLKTIVDTRIFTSFWPPLSLNRLFHLVHLRASSTLAPPPARRRLGFVRISGRIAGLAGSMHQSGNSQPNGASSLSVERRPRTSLPSVVRCG
jgi:hypothetical protein